VIARARHLYRMLRNERLEARQLLQQQQAALTRLVRHAAANVPYYRELYRSHGIEVAAFDARNLERLPVVDKALLRAAGSQARSLHAPHEGVTLSTSGSTGEPFSWQIDRGYDQWRKAQYLRPYLRCGRTLRDRVLRLTAFPVQHRSLASRLGLLREWQLHCSTPPAEVQAHWRRHRPDVLQGYPSALRALAHHCLETTSRLEPAPRLVFTDSEQLLPDTRSLLERAFGTPVIDIFGTYETDNIAWQCPHRGAYHVATDCVLLEVLRNGRPAPPGEQGELVVTVLRNFSAPFIRYNLHDLGELLAEPCPCGSPFPLLVRLEGRADDLLVLENGTSRTPMGVLGQLDRYLDQVRHYQLRQLDLRRFELLIVPTSRFDAAVAARILDDLRRSLPAASVELKLVEQIAPQRSGKRLAFVRT